MQNEERILGLLEHLVQDVSGLKQSVSGLERETAGLKQEMAELKEDVSTPVSYTHLTLPTIA